MPAVGQCKGSIAGVTLSNNAYTVSPMITRARLTELPTIVCYICKDVRSCLHTFDKTIFFLTIRNKCHVQSGISSKLKTTFPTSFRFAKVPFRIKPAQARSLASGHGSFVKTASVVPD